MKAQVVVPKPFDQDPADAEPQRITTGQHYCLLLRLQGKQGVAEGHWIVAGDPVQVAWASRPSLQLRQQSLRCRHQVGVLHQTLTRWRERAGGASVSADHVDHEAIVLG